jgi:hypothetical protein
VSQAEDLHHAALALQTSHDFQLGVVQSLEALSELAAVHESWAEAIRVFAAVGRLRHDLGYECDPLEAEAYQVAVVASRDGMGEDGFDHAWAEGTVLPDILTDRVRVAGNEEVVDGVPIVP